MYLRLRKRKKPLPTDTPTTDPVPLSGTEDPAPSASTEWIPAEPGGEEAPGTDVSGTRHPNRGKAHESARGSHR